MYTKSITSFKLNNKQFLKLFKKLYQDEWRYLTVCILHWYPNFFLSQRREHVYNTLGTCMN